MRCHGCDPSKVIFEKAPRKQETPVREVIEMEKEKRGCVQCGSLYEPKRADSRFCSKICMGKWYRTNTKKNGNRRKYRISKPPAILRAVPKLDDAIFLPPESIKALRNAGIKEAIKILERALA